MHALSDLSGGGTPTLGLNAINDLKGGAPHLSHYNGIRLIIMIYSDFHGRITPPLTRPKNGGWDITPALGEGGSTRRTALGDGPGRVGGVVQGVRPPRLHDSPPSLTKDGGTWGGTSRTAHRPQMLSTAANGGVRHTSSPK